MNSKRLTTISTLLADYSVGNFSKKADVSENLDEIDSIIMGINMLGEELEDTTISKNIFENIFNSVSNILFIVNKDGIITGANEYGKKIQSIKINETKLSNLCSIRSINDSFSYLSKHSGIEFEVEYISKTNKIVYTQTSMVRLSGKAKDSEGDFLVISKDITDKKEHHLQILKTIINTQEIERKRVADDLHDSLGQELSSIRMMFSAINTETISPSNLTIITTCNTILQKSISDLRTICFNMMPASLETADLITAINELLEHTLIRTQFNTNSEYISLEKEKKTALYRVFQEFLNNSIKHSKASLVSIDFKMKEDNLEIKLSDNGIGFNINSTHAKGRGLMTMKNRIDSINGQFSLKSDKGTGTHLTIEIKCKE